jgi:acyl-CoA thioester hydrolase
MPRPPPGIRADYHVFLPITTRWMDNDVFGHLNNVVYYSLFDTAVCHSLVTRGILQIAGGSHIMVIAESGCRYHSEVAFPDPVVAGIRVASIGSSSVRHEIGVFRGEQDAAAAEGFMVHVCVDTATRRPAPLPAVWRESLSAQSLSRIGA